jgi:hypothetical protein
MQVKFMIVRLDFVNRLKKAKGYDDLETFLAKKRLELLINPYADRVMARIE